MRTTHSTADGSFTLGGLTPGEYNIVVAAPGFDPVSQTVTVLVGQSLEMNPQLAQTSVLRESITVVGTQAVETETSEIATNVTTHQIENLPQDDRNFLNFAALAPGIRLSKDPLRKTFAGDTQDPEQTNIYIDGVSTKNDILQGGTSGQDASRGNPFSQSAVQEFRVITQNYSAQYGQASSAIITAVTKSGGNDLSGQAFIYYQPNAWVEETEKNFQFSTLATNSEYRRLRPGISLGGPIMKDRLHFFVTYEGDDEDAETPVVITRPEFASQFSQYVGSFPSPFRSTLLFGKTSWQIAPEQLAELSANYRREKETRDFGNQNSFESATDFQNRVYGATARHQWINGSALNEATLSLQKFGWNPEPRNPDLVGRRYFAPGFATVIRIGGASTTQEFSQRRLELRDNYHFAPMSMAGTHRFQVGGNIDRMRFKVNKSLSGNPEFKFLPDANGVFGNIPFEADFGIGNPRLELSNTEYGIYGQDKWEINDKLTLDIGLRWDYESKMLDDEYVTPANIVAALKGSPSRSMAAPSASPMNISRPEMSASPIRVCGSRVSESHGTCAATAGRSSSAAGANITIGSSSIRRSMRGSACSSRSIASASLRLGRHDQHRLSPDLRIVAGIDQLQRRSREAGHHVRRRVGHLLRRVRAGIRSGDHQ